ncbi:ComEC/Rec2 family competence protein [Erythrobacter sp. QSSC1-22B]|uniref:ComEC/Rec2 family competence protein n=1 Tax=Erythrobacter sp. QSSC1-22B TaxID=1860125 RepID=UPI00351110AC
MSSLGDAAENFFNNAGSDRGPWLTVAFAIGIGTWFLLDSVWQWVGFIACCVFAALAAAAMWRGRGDRVRLLVTAVSVCIMLVAGVTTIWARSEMVGAKAIDYPQMMRLDARILERDERPAEDRTRLVLAVRDAASAQAMKVRINVPLASDDLAFTEGARIRLRARLMPPASPILPGTYDFARAAWFEGLAATGSLVGDIELVEPAVEVDALAGAQRRLSAHVRKRLDGSPGTIAAAFASGDRGSIAEGDDIAMRDSGLYHLLSISGVHVSAVIAAAYFLAMKLLALWPWLVLRVRLPLAAAAIGAAAGIGYTLLTGAEVPTVRSCVAALLVLLAISLGREPLSMRMVAVAGFVVLLMWPEALVGPSFQMSFSAVIAIVALSGAGWVKRFLAAREESWFARTGRRVLILFLTGLLIEFALMPVVLFHFHRAGFYGAFANIVGIPLVTFVTMPALALALLLDLVGMGRPIWWVVGYSLELLLVLARAVAEQPGAVKLLPQMRLGTLLTILAGLAWLALWRGGARAWGLVPVILGTSMFLATPKADLLISRDGRHVGIVGQDERLLVLRDSRSSYARDNLLEMAGSTGEVIPLDRWPQARCTPEFCTITLRREGRDWHVLMARSRGMVEERALAAACDRADIVVAERFLPRSCRPLWLKADRRFLEREGGALVYLDEGQVRTVAQAQGTHGWWRGTRE